MINENRKKQQIFYIQIHGQQHAEKQISIQHSTVLQVHGVYIMRCKWHCILKFSSLNRNISYDAV